jgi:phage head maturation protease
MQDLVSVLDVKTYYSDFTVTKNVGDRIVLAGYMSTNDVDYTNEVIEAESWNNESFQHYKELGTYLWNHNFNSSEWPPIGKCNNPYIDSKGLYFDDIVLTPIPFVRDIIIPLVKDEVLKNQSVGFRSLKRRYDQSTGITYHTQCELLEGSLVPVACNRHATVGMKSWSPEPIPGFEKYTSMEELVTDYLSGKLVIAHKHFVPSGYNVIEKEQLPDNSGSIETENMEKKNLSVTVANPTLLTVADKTPVIVSKTMPEYAKVAPCIYAVAKTGEEKSYLYPIGYATKSGFNYDLVKAGNSLCQALIDFRKGAHEELDAQDVMKRIREAYIAEGKEFPSCAYTEEPLDEMASWKLKNLTLKEVVFPNAEHTSYSLERVTNALRSAEEGIKSLGQDAKLSEEAVNYAKAIYGYVDVNFSASTYGTSLPFLLDLLEQVWQHNNPDLVDPTEGAESTDPMYIELGDVRTRFVKYIDGDVYAFGEVAGDVNMETGLVPVVKYSEEFTKTTTVVNVSVKELTPSANLEEVRQLLAAKALVESKLQEFIESVVVPKPEEKAWHPFDFGNSFTFGK